MFLKYTGWEKAWVGKVGGTELASQRFQPSESADSQLGFFNPETLVCMIY